MRDNGFRAIGGLAQRLSSHLARGRAPGKGQARGGGAAVSIARLRADWPAIVGTELCRKCRPEALLPGRGRLGKSLRLRVAGAMALEVQHRGGEIIERVNGHFGHRFIDDIRLVQGTLAQQPAPRILPAASPETLAGLEGKVAKVSDPELRAALARLGARVAAGRRSVLVGALSGLVWGAHALRPSRAQPNQEQLRLLDVLPTDHVMGKPDAPNVIIDYFSLTCPHCANFHAAILPPLRREWIDSGRARFVYRHFPSDSIATHASQLTECAGDGRFYEAIDELFRTQVDWLTAADPEADMVQRLTGKGIAVGSCLAEDHFSDKVIGDVQSGQALGVRATPTVIINGFSAGSPASADYLGGILREHGR